MSPSADAEALYQLGMKHVYGDTVPEDYGRAVELLTQAYALGHVEAAYNLGICYHYGFGVAVDLARAYELYRFAADHGYAKGKHLIGRFYYNGWHVRQDYAEAIRWFEASAALQDPTSCGFDYCYLGACYAKGYGVITDQKKAEELFQRGVAEGGEDAKQLIQRLLQ